MTFTYTLLGLLSASLGLRLGFLFQSRLFLVLLILFFLIMACAMLGLIQLELPLRFRNFLSNVGGQGPKGAFLAGLTIGFIASPCVGPMMGPLLLWAAQVQNIYLGASALFFYALGMGSLFIIGGSFYASLGSKIKGGSFTQGVKRFIAVLLILPALYYGHILYQQTFGKKVQVGWSSSLQDGLSLAKEQEKPVVIDFYADWCLPCLELDHKTFSAPELKSDFEEVIKIKIDCTLESTACNEAVSKYDVVGWPTVLFLDKKQNLQKDLSIVGGFVGPEKMKQILNELKKR
ncbi:MAG: thioredoxin family protein [Deltaproteobacteria bacterium]|nr:thioredoxin family protein [Deltaproteobacteria bacterium]